MWKRKMNKKEKTLNRLCYEKRRKMMHPTRVELHDSEKTLEYCILKKLSKSATDRTFRLVEGKLNDIDWRDQRTLKKEDRVPRSLEMCSTPPGYWDVSI